jgi:hypothetical protein
MALLSLEALALALAAASAGAGVTIRASAAAIAESALPLSNREISIGASNLPPTTYGVIDTLCYKAPAVAKLNRSVRKLLICGLFYLNGDFVVQTRSSLALWIARAHIAAYVRPA